MTLTLTLSPDREAKLHREASLAGLPVEEYALRLLDGADLNGVALDALAPPALPPLPQDSPEWGAALREWGKNGKSTASLSLEATSRESIYGDDLR